MHFVATVMNCELRRDLQWTPCATRTLSKSALICAFKIIRIRLSIWNLLTMWGLSYWFATRLTLKLQGDSYLFTCTSLPILRALAFMASNCFAIMLHYSRFSKIILVRVLINKTQVLKTTKEGQSAGASFTTMRFYRMCLNASLNIIMPVNSKIVNRNAFSIGASSRPQVFGRF